MQAQHRQISKRIDFEPRLSKLVAAPSCVNLVWQPAAAAGGSRFSDVDSEAAADGPDVVLYRARSKHGGARD